MKNITSIIKIGLVLFILGGIALYISSCKKNDPGNTATTITEADAAELTTDAISPASGGMVTQLSSAVTIYNNVALACGVVKDSTLVKASASGATPSYSYSLFSTSNLACNGLVPNQLTFNFNGTGSYDGLRMSSSDKSTGALVLTGVGTDATQYNLNTTYQRSGNTTSKISGQYTFNSSLTIVATNIAIDKTSQEIVSGTANVSITATLSSGTGFAFAGTLIFLGGKKAYLVLNSGTTYTIQWS